MYIGCDADTSISCGGGMFVASDDITDPEAYIISITEFNYIDVTTIKEIIKQQHQ